MFNVYQVCRLCMLDIGFGGTDCMCLRDLREAIKILYNLEIKSTDECSKRVCHQCFRKVAEFMLHHKTVSETQEKIKKFVTMHKKMNEYSNNIKVKNEIRDEEEEEEEEEDENEVMILINDDDIEVIDVDQPSTERSISLNSSLATTADDDEVTASNKSTSTNSASARVNGTAEINSDSVPITSTEIVPKTGKSPQTVIRPVLSDAEIPLIDIVEDSEDEEGEKDEGEISTIRNSATRKRRPTVSNSTEPKKSRVEIKPTAIINTSQASDFHKSRSSSTKHSKEIAKSKKSTVANSIKMYFSKPGCERCNIKLKTWSERNFHQYFHKKNRCMECGRKESTPNEATIKRHVYSCLLFSGKLSNKELLKYMKPCVVRIKKTNYTSGKIAEIERKWIKQSKGKHRESLTTKSKLNARVSTNVTEHKVNGNKNSKKQSSTKLYSKDNNSNHSGRNDPMKNKASKPVSPKKKGCKSSFKSVKADAISQHISKNNSIPFRWDQQGSKDKLFFVQSFEKMQSTYLDIDASKENPIESTKNYAVIETICEKLNAYKRAYLTGSKGPVRENLHTTKRSEQATSSANTVLPLNRPYLQPVPRNRSMSIAHSASEINTPETEKFQFRRQSTHSAHYSNNNVNNQYSKSHTTSTDELSDRNHSNCNEPIRVGLTENTAQSKPLPINNSNGLLNQLAAENRVSVSIVPNITNNVKILSVYELNSRAVQMNPNPVNYSVQSNSALSGSRSIRIGPQIKYVPIRPKPFATPHPFSSNEKIHASLHARVYTGQLELVLTCNENIINYDELNQEKRIEVQTYLLMDDVWLGMLKKIIKAKVPPTKETLDLFKKILPPREWHIFFDHCTSSGKVLNRN